MTTSNSQTTSRPATLAGKLVVLRPAVETDVVSRLRWRLDEDVQRFAEERPWPRTIANVESVTANFLASFRRGMNRTTDDRFLYMITLPRPGAPRVDGRPIGMITCAREGREARLGVLIGEKDCWGKGYASDAVWTLLSVIFTEPGIARVSAETRADNEPAVRLFTQCGFREVERRERRLPEGDRTYLRLELTSAEYLG